jgi:pimeloyl-ACP methyl ester carboxylesterase
MGFFSRQSQEEEAAMSKATANGIQIEYETFGNPSSRPLLLIIGLGGQLIFWDDALCKNLAGRGNYVIRFDNRDAGLSTKFEEAGVPNLAEIIGKIMQGEKVKPPYTLEDMADDAAGLLQALGIQRAHVCGMSMGGMIAQTLAIRHPSRVLSLISIYSTTGNPELPQPKPEVIGLLIAPPPKERDACIKHLVGVFKAFAGPGFPFDEKWTHKIMAQAYDRCFYPEGMARQLVAILAQGNRKPALASLKVPTLVIHGIQDPLVSVEGGKDTAKAIPGAKLMLIEGMGHDLPHSGAWPRIVEAIAAHTLKATP